MVALAYPPAECSDRLANPTGAPISTPLGLTGIYKGQRRARWARRLAHVGIWS